MRSRSIRSRSIRSLGAGPDAGHAIALSFIGVVIALYLVRKGSELPRLHVWIQLDVDAASPIPIVPGFAWGAFLHACWRAEHGAYLAFALAHECDRRRGSGGRRGADRRLLRIGLGVCGLGLRLGSRRGLPR